MTKDDNKKQEEKEPSSAKATEGEGENAEELKKQRDEYLAGWQRARADFLNYKKEEVERFGDIIKFANEEIILRMLPILDNFELVEKSLSETHKNDEYIKGLLQIKLQLCDFLKSQGVEEIKTTNVKFDPNFHEVIGEVGPSEDLAKETKSGIVIEEIQKGYTLNGKVIRPAKVKVAK